MTNNTIFPNRLHNNNNNHSNNYNSNSNSNNSYNHIHCIKLLIVQYLLRQG